MASTTMSQVIFSAAHNNSCLQSARTRQPTVQTCFLPVTVHLSGINRLESCKRSISFPSVDLKFPDVDVNDCEEEEGFLEEEKTIEAFPAGLSRSVLLGAVSIGIVVMLSEVYEQRAMAFGPEGPLMEEFWDNVRRYGLYILTVSTGAIYTILQPLVELLKNPITAILILILLAAAFFLLSQVLNAMVGVTEFAYDYAY